MMRGMNKLSFIYIFSFFLLWYLQGHQTYEKTNLPSFIQDKREQIQKEFKDPKKVELLLSYVAGDYKKISKEIKDAHKILGLNHLFTPSGIHLSALFLLLFPLLFWLRKKNRILHFLFGTALYLSPFFLLPTFYAAKRISLLRIFSLWKEFIPYHFSFFWIFLLAFGVDFLLGGYAASPGSFIYSFLFIGILFSCEKTPAIRLHFRQLDTRDRDATILEANSIRKMPR